MSHFTGNPSGLKLKRLFLKCKILLFLNPMHFILFHLILHQQFFIFAFYNQEKRVAHRKDKEPRKLTFEQKLSIILNDRPGLDGDRKTISMVQMKKADFPAHIPQTSDNRQVRPPLENTTNKIMNQKDDERVPVPIGSASNVLSGRPKPNMPGQLCHIAYISPWKKQGTAQRGTVRKSPSKYLSELANPTLNTPSRGTSRKIMSSSKTSPCRFTAEALYNIRNGLPLPPKERRYEFVERSKWEDAATPKVGEEAKSKTTKDPSMGVASSAKNKKSVRWADSPYSKQSEAHKKLNFDAVSVHFRTLFMEFFVRTFGNYT